MRLLKVFRGFIGHIARRQDKLEANLVDLAEGITFDVDNIIEELADTSRELKTSRLEIQRLWNRIESINEVLAENQRERERLLAEYR